MAEIKPVAEYTADDMQQQWDEARSREREIWEHRVRNLHAEVAAWQERYMQIVKRVAAGAAMLPPAPIIIDSTALEAARAEERERCAMEVWHTMMQATAEDADDRGLDGWMRSAEAAIRNLK